MLSAPKHAEKPEKTSAYFLSFFMMWFDMDITSKGIFQQKKGKSDTKIDQKNFGLAPRGHQKDRRKFPLNYLALLLFLGAKQTRFSTE